MVESYKIIKGAPRHPLLKPKIMKKQMDYFFNLILIPDN
jgi:hypothetical protein